MKVNPNGSSYSSLNCLKDVKSCNREFSSKIFGGFLLTKDLNITIYGKPGCSQCVAAKLFLDRKGHKYEYIDVMAGDISSDDIKHLLTVIAPGAQSFPIIIINGHFIGTTEHLYGIFQ